MRDIIDRHIGVGRRDSGSVIDRIRSAAPALVFGLVVGVAAFWATSMVPITTFLGPLGLEDVIRMPGHDPLTGRPHGGIIVVSDAFLDPPVVTRRTIEVPPPDTFRQAIPVPIGWAFGALGWVAVRRWRARRRS